MRKAVQSVQLVHSQKYPSRVSQPVGVREALLRQEAPMYPRPDVQEQPLRHDHGALLFEVQHDGNALARTGWHAMTGARDLDREATQQLEPGM